MRETDSVNLGDQMLRAVTSRSRTRRRKGGAFLSQARSFPALSSTPDDQRRLSSKCPCRPGCSRLGIQPAAPCSTSGPAHKHCYAALAGTALCWWKACWILKTYSNSLLIWERCCPSDGYLCRCTKYQILLSMGCACQTGLKLYIFWRGLYTFLVIHCEKIKKSA